MGKGRELGTGLLSQDRHGPDIEYYHSQICLAPDYVLVPREFQDTFVAALQRAYVCSSSARVQDTKCDTDS